MIQVGPIPEVLYRKEAPPAKGVPLLVAGLCKGAPPPSPIAEIPEAKEVLRRGDFHGESMETALLYPADGGPERLLLLGLGDGNPSLQTARRWALRAVAEARRVRVQEAALLLPEGNGDERKMIVAAAQGAVLGSRLSWKEEKVPLLERIVLIGKADGRAGEAAAKEGAGLAEAAFFARQLAMEPANHLPPAALAAEASRVAEESGAAIRILDENDLKSEGLAAILAVGSGSVQPPRLIELVYDGSGGGGPTVALVGKGVTFDSGGLSLKPADRMVHMKYDMSGAAAVLAAIRGAARLALPIRVAAVVPSAENMPGPHSYRPGDVISSYKKVTVEVDNTDAEGRLLLADALAWAEERLRPDVMIDIATLTGACKIALGRHAAGLFTSDDGLAAALVEVGAESGDRLWRLPLWDSYDKELESDVADLKNVGRAAVGGGAAVAARFLARFVERTPWAHLDIAGMAWSDGKRDLGPAGSTGFGAAVLLAYLVRRAKS